MSINVKDDWLAVESEGVLEEQDCPEITESDRRSQNIEPLENLGSCSSRKNYSTNYNNFFGQTTPVKYKIPKRNASSDSKVAYSSIVKSTKTKKRKRSSYSIGDDAAFSKPGTEFDKNASENMQILTLFERENLTRLASEHSSSRTFSENINKPSTSYERENIDDGVLATGYSSPPLFSQDYSQPTYDFLRREIPSHSRSQNREHFIDSKSGSSSSKSSEHELSFEYDTDVVAKKSSSSKVIAIGKAIKKASDKKMFKKIETMFNYGHQPASDSSNFLQIGEFEENPDTCGNAANNSNAYDIDDLYDDLDVSEACDLYEHSARQEESNDE